MNSTHRLLYFLACAGAVLLPLGLLFDLRSAFYAKFDWENNLWLTGFFGDYLKHHFQTPTELNTVPAVGMAIPMFYGYLLYPLLGLCSAFSGPVLALRLGCLITVMVQFYALLTAGRSVWGHRGLSFTVAAASVWSTYALTNLYNRSAMPEYFATGWLCSAIGFAVTAAASVGERRRFYAWLAGICAVLTAGSHPPTAVVAPVLWAALALILMAHWLRSGRKVSPRTLGVAVGGASLAALSLAPWFYLTAKWSSVLATWSEPYGPVIYHDRSDSLLGRFSPQPYDRLSLYQGTTNVGTPYLEAPVALPLLAVVVWCWFASRHARTLPPPQPKSGLWSAAAPAALIAAIIWTGFLTAFSLSSAMTDRFQLVGPMIQFTYRLVAHINAGLLVAVFAAGAMAAAKGVFERCASQVGLLSAVALTMAAMALVSKLEHAATIVQTENFPQFVGRGREAPLVQEGRFYLNESYTTPKLRPVMPGPADQPVERVAFPVTATGSRFGQVGSVVFHRKQPGWVVTNALVFPFARILVDGVKLPGSSLARRESFLAARLPAGDHVLSWDWHDDPYWLVLHRLGQGAFVVGVVIAGFWAGARFRAARRLRIQGLTC